MVRKTTHKLAIIALLLITGCSPDDNSPQTGPAMEMVALLTEANDYFLTLAEKAKGDPGVGLYLLADWLMEKPEVEAVRVIDSTHVRILLKSEIITGYHINIVDDNGISIRRGGSITEESYTYSTGKKRCANEMENKKVLILSPIVDEFYTEEEAKAVLKIFESASDFEVTVLIGEQVKYESLRTFGDYGLVIINTHGMHDAFLLSRIDFMWLNDGFGEKPPFTEEKFKKGINELVGPGTYERIVSNKMHNVFYSNIKRNPGIFKWDLYLNATFDLWITSKGIAEMPQWDQTIIFGNFCYSGALKLPENEDSKLFEPVMIGSAFLNKNPITYYGYNLSDGTSRPVENSFAKEMEKHIARQLVTAGDSTGNAHLSPSGEEFADPKWTAGKLTLKQFQKETYCFAGCAGEGTFTDPRDKVTYKTICINNKTWMAENLNTSAFRNGDPIPEAKTFEEWNQANLNKQPAWCYYENNPANSVYGKLYNWYAVNDPRGLAPEGWKIPTHEDWTDLTVFLGPKAGLLMKSTSGWINNGNGTNTSGFNALPGGYRNLIFNASSHFSFIGEYAKWWTSSISSDSNGEWAHSRFITGAYDRVFDDVSPARMGLSVRCIK